MIERATTRFGNLVFDRDAIVRAALHAYVEANLTRMDPLDRLNFTVEVGPEHGEKWAGVGFWLYVDRVAGTLFDDPTASGAHRLAMWGALRDGRLPLRYDRKTTAEIAEQLVRRGTAPIQAIVDAVTARALAGPTELTTDELATLPPAPPDPYDWLSPDSAFRRWASPGPARPRSPS